MLRWLAGRGASRRRVARELAQISDDTWRMGLRRHAFLAGLSVDEDAALRERSAWLLASKTFSGAQGLDVTPEMMLSVAMQAALPILALDTALYEGWTEIILYPGGFLIPRSEIDESGVLHEYVQEASGEAWEGGPVILSWEDSVGPADSRVNVVIHEFAHKLDLYGGDADGIPSLHGRRDIQRRQWVQVLEESYDSFCRSLDAVEMAIPSNVDPESEQATSWYDALPLDAYAATDPAEFFAVSSEGFFVDPAPLARSLPRWYALLRSYYRQDPLQRLTGA